MVDAVYDLSAERIALAVDMLLNHRELAVQDPDVVTSALERIRKHPGLGFSDCLIVEIARKSGHLPLGTFDRDLAKLDGVKRIR
jgi:predicted nucleic acid-binding protein